MYSRVYNRAIYFFTFSPTCCFLLNIRRLGKLEIWNLEISFPLKTSLFSCLYLLGRVGTPGFLLPFALSVVISALFSLFLTSSLAFSVRTDEVFKKTTIFHVLSELYSNIYLYSWSSTHGLHLEKICSLVFHKWVKLLLIIFG